MLLATVYPRPNPKHEGRRHRCGETQVTAGVGIIGMPACDELKRIAKEEAP
jgi:hypothetical protein